MSSPTQQPTSDDEQPQDLSQKNKQHEENADPPTDNTLENSVSVQPAKPPGKKSPPDVLCTCPQKCDSRVPQEARVKLYEHFGRLRDHATQNSYLQSYIEMRSVYRRLWAEEERVRGRLPRRVSCKYRIPTSDLPPVTPVDLPKPRLITNSKGKATFVMTPRGKGKTIEVCQKAFMNVYGITEKRVRLQREKLIARLRDRSPPPLIPPPQIVGIHMEDHDANQTDCELREEEETLAVAIVDSFFQNQLWKPEYIGITKDKFEHIIA